MAKYVVPEAGLKAACDEICELGTGSGREVTRKVLEAFIRWQSENPQVPTTEWLDEFNRVGEIKPFKDFRGAMIAAWIGRMYLAEPEPEVPKEIKDLLLPIAVESGFFKPEVVNERIIEAERRGFIRGQKAGK